MLRLVIEVLILVLGFFALGTALGGVALRLLVRHSDDVDARAATGSGGKQ